MVLFIATNYSASAQTFVETRPQIKGTPPKRHVHAIAQPAEAGQFKPLRGLAIDDPALVRPATISPST
jgi:hypothetical protein